ncbi:uncharacterized protein EMH_0076400 [Eimeria mitis]|uniref:Uncharacterized protein n=1 Tax=Eimeria mitis TaxID=44415 RepID=U6KAT9_9EIME|nr:uncharacterized protein EMH_0076400 [Eimeria mitis]CDJ32608.1 hypothetical protein EMH_0076400 [Eimeria mitis]
MASATPPQEVGWALRNAVCRVLRVVDVFGSRQPGEDTVSSICADHGISHGEWLSLVRVGMWLSLRSALRVVDVFGSRQPELAYLSDVLGIAVVFYRLARA